MKNAFRLSLVLILAVVVLVFILNVVGTFVTLKYDIEDLVNTRAMNSLYFHANVGIAAFAVGVSASFILGLRWRNSRRVE